MDTEARHWGGYVIWLERARGQLPPAASALGWREIDDSHTDHLMELLREREAPHAAAIRTAIDAWIESGVWPELADVARWFLNLRMETSLNLVVQLCHCGEGAESSLWDFPAGMDEADGSPQKRMRLMATSYMTAAPVAAATSGQLWPAG